MIKLLFASTALLALCACNIPPLGGSTTVTTAPTGPIQVTGPQAKLDFTTTAANFDAAAGAGLTDMEIFATCQHQLNQDFGVEVVAGAPTYPTFDVTNNGVVSAISIVIIDADKAKLAAANGLSIPQSCAEVFGVIGIQGWASALSLGPIHITIVPDTPAIAKLASQTAVLGGRAPTPVKKAK